MLKELNNLAWPQIFAILIGLWIIYLIVYVNIGQDCCSAEELNAERLEIKLGVLRDKCARGEISKSEYEKFKRELIAEQVSRAEKNLK